MRTRCLRMLVAAVVTVCLLGLAEISSAQGQRSRAFEQVREVQERHTQKMMVKEGIVGTAVGLDETGEYAVLVLLEGPSVRDVPADLEGIPVRLLVTGRVYAVVPALFRRHGRIWTDGSLFLRFRQERTMVWAHFGKTYGGDD